MNHIGIPLKKKKKSKGAWIDTMYDNVGKFCNLETQEGVNRSGKLSGIRTKNIELNGERVEIVVELELNGDPTDTLFIASLSKISIG